LNNYEIILYATVRVVFFLKKKNFVWEKICQVLKWKCTFQGGQGSKLFRFSRILFVFKDSSRFYPSFRMSGFKKNFPFEFFRYKIKKEFSKEQIHFFTNNAVLFECPQKLVIEQKGSFFPEIRFWRMKYCNFLFSLNEQSPLRNVFASKTFHIFLWCKG